MKQSVCNRKLPEPDYLPSQEKIKEECERIQRTWSEDTRLKRQYGVTQEQLDSIRWSPPMYNARDMQELVNSTRNKHQVEYGIANN